MNLLRLACVTFVAAVLAACGGGGGDGGGGPTPPVVTAPSALTYPVVPPLTVNAAAAAVSPTVTGTVTGYTVNPALPAGLTLNASTGAISGTPTAVSAASSYVVTASNAGGNTTATVSITVNDVAPAFSYSPNSFTFSEGSPVSAVTPGSSGGAVVAWSVQPALPAGLVLNPATGALSGTPTAITARADYAVRAQNSGGSITQNVSITVQSSVLIDLGLASAEFVDASATRVITLDEHNWVLWNATTRDLIARAPTEADQPPVLLGNTFLVRNGAALESHDATTGALLASIAYDDTRSWWVLSRDGGWFAVGGRTGLTIYSRDGAQRATRAGNYVTASAFADTTALRVAKSPSGANVFEIIDSASGALTLSPAFLGTFSAWFGDGQRFFTATGSTIRIYSLASVQEDIIALSNQDQFAGYGDWFSVFREGYYNYPVSIYRVGSSSTPAASYTPTYPDIPLVDGPVIAILQNDSDLQIVDLSGSVLVSNLVIGPGDFPARSYAQFAAVDATHWWSSAAYGRVYDGSSDTSTPRYLGFGSVFAIVASPTIFAVATHAHGIQIYDAQSRALLRTIDLHCSDLSISADGTTLAALGFSDSWSVDIGDDRSLYLLSTATGALLNVWPATYGTGTYYTSVELSANGAVLAATRYTGARLTDVVLLPTAGGPAIYSAITPFLRPSPDGTFAAESLNTGPNGTTNLRENGVLRQAVPGAAVAWLGDDRLMVNRYAQISGSTWDYHHTEFYDRAGMLQGSVTLAHFPRDIQPLGSDQVYDRTFNYILSLTTGQVIWNSPSNAVWLARGIGSVAGNNVVFLAGPSVRIEPR